MRYRLRTLLIVLALGLMALCALWLLWDALRPVPHPAQYGPRPSAIVYYFMIESGFGHVAAMVVVSVVAVWIIFRFTAHKNTRM
jgi:hypothetical protein